jgi:hypothetical protein
MSFQGEMSCTIQQAHQMWGETWLFAAKITLLFLLTITPCHLGICRKFLGSKNMSAGGGLERE